VAALHDKRRVYWRNQTCYQFDQSNEGLQIDLFAKTRIVNRDLIDLSKTELSEFRLS
jgi:hypothetical protein